MSAPAPHLCPADQPGDWPADQLAEARAILADCVHHPDSLIVIACRTLARHSLDPSERREAEALAGLLIGRTAGKGGAA